MYKRKWWKESVMYQIYPRSFYDSNHDGIGDIQGIIQKLDHLSDLGVDIIWLGPVYESPNDDNGYDISDYRNIHADFGSMEDFEELLSSIHQRGMKLIMDLVVNHSSDEHYWFKESKKSKDNPYRDYYIWRKGKDGSEPNNFLSFFGGKAWHKSEETDEYYLHLFTKKQPDLNWENPVVRREVYDIMKFWLDKGIDGFRMDVISLISKTYPFKDVDDSDINKMIQNEYANGPRIHEYLQEMYQEVLSKYDVMTVGEGPGITKDHALDYIGDVREELNMIFQLELMFIDFGANGKFDYQAFTLKDMKMLLLEWDSAIGNEGWNNIFLDNHDFPRMLSRFGNDEKYRIESAKLLSILLLTFRGTPCIYQGSEIGMTNVSFNSIEDYRDVETFNMHEEFVGKGRMSEEEFLKAVHIQGRDNARTPMQWNNEINAGFSKIEPWIKTNPNYSTINVTLDKSSAQSIFNFYKEIISYRKQNKDLIYGDLMHLDRGDDQVFAYERIGNDNSYVIVLNMSDQNVDFELKRALADYKIEKFNYKTIPTLIGNKIKLRSWEAVIFKSNIEVKS